MAKKFLKKTYHMAYSLANQQQKQKLQCAHGKLSEDIATEYVTSGTKNYQPGIAESFISIQDKEALRHLNNTTHLRHVHELYVTSVNVIAGHVDDSDIHAYALEQEENLSNARSKASKQFLNRNNSTSESTPTPTVL